MFPCHDSSLIDMPDAHFLIEYLISHVMWTRKRMRSCSVCEIIVLLLYLLFSHVIWTRIRAKSCSVQAIKHAFRKFPRGFRVQPLISAASAKRTSFCLVSSISQPPFSSLQGDSLTLAYSLATLTAERWAKMKRREHVFLATGWQKSASSSLSGLSCLLTPLSSCLPLLTRTLIRNNIPSLSIRHALSLCLTGESEESCRLIKSNAVLNYYWGATSSLTPFLLSSRWIRFFIQNDLWSLVGIFGCVSSFRVLSRHSRDQWDHEPKPLSSRRWPAKVEVQRWHCKSE